MKKKSLLVICLLLVTCYLLSAQTGTIREIVGEVEIKPAGAASFSPARTGSTVSQDTIISTGFRSTAVVVIGSNTITVQPLTRLTLAEISASSGAENLNVSLQTGRVRVEVNPPSGTRASTRVQTPSATASVRGTVFEMDTVNLSVTEGTVMFTGQNGLNVPVTAGSTSSISIDGTAVEPVIISESELTPPSPVGIGMSGENISSSAELQNNVQFNLIWDAPN